MMRKQMHHKLGVECIDSKRKISEPIKTII